MEMKIKTGRKYRFGNKVFLLKDITKTLTDLDAYQYKVVDCVVCKEVKYDSATEELKNSLNDSTLNENVIFSIKDFKENMIPLEIDFDEVICEYCMGRILKHYIVKNIYPSKGGKTIVKAYNAGNENDYKEFFAEIDRRGMIKPVQNFDSTKEYYFLSEKIRRNLYGSVHLEEIIKILKACVDKISKIDPSTYPVDLDLDSKIKNFCENLVRSLKA